MICSPDKGGQPFGTGFSARHFWIDETGAISVDWVVLTAGVMIVALAIGIKVASGAETLGNDISADLNALVTS